LLAERAAVPLVWDENSMLTGEQFDAVASAEVLPYLYCLRGDRDLKKAPAGSPLVQAVWAELQDGAKTVTELVTGVGQEITEAAVLRALRELWVKLRVVPLLEPHASSEGAVWDLLQRVYPAGVKQGATMSQPLAVSAMVSVYLSGAVAATADEVEDALGPLASRSRVREVLNALQATRQLAMLPVGRSMAYALAGGSAEVLGEIAEKRDTDALKIAKLEAKVAAAGRSPREFGERKAWAKDRGVAARTKPRSDRPASAESASTGGDRAWKPRAEGAGFAARKPYGKREGGAGEKREWKPRAAASDGAPRKPFVKRDGPGGERKPWVKRDGASAGGERKEWKPRAASAGFPARKPFVKRDAGDGPPRKPFVKREGGAGERKEWKPRAAGAGFPARKPFVKREGGDFPPRTAKPAGERREWKQRPAPGSGASGRKPFGSGAGGERKPSTKRAPGDYPPRRAEGKSFGGPRKFGAKPFGAKPGGFARKPFGAKPGGFAKKPFGARPGGPSAGGPAKRTYKRKDEDA
jgi:hypothetical protein